ncbi:MAG: FAD-dependent oxidoreductase [Rhodospirillaceae bacterium]
MPPGRRVAVVGAGIAGLASAWLISQRHDVDLIEASGRLGGHVNTVDVAADGVTRPVDTGFIVHNPLNFPDIVALFAHLGVATEDSDMSFAVSARNGGLEYAGGLGPRGVFAQPANLLRPAFWRMLADILRFNRAAAGSLELPASVTLGDWLDGRDFGTAFRDDHLLPMTAAIWSAGAGAMLEFPAAALFRFLHAHRLLRVFGRPQWRTVSNGCRSYVDALIRNFPGNVYSSTPVRKVTRREGGVLLEFERGESREYDFAVLATHADRSLSMLADADASESAILGAFRYAPNRAVLHRDTSFMPRRRAAWASWNYVAADSGGHVTYWMNRLQNIDGIDNLFVTLDPPREPRETLAAFDYEHPQFDSAAIEAQPHLPEIQGRRGVWFCGAWCGYGFHEDGLRSAMRIAADFGAVAPWSAR